MKVSNIIKTIPDDGDRLNQPVEIEVQSHWNYDDRVHFVIEANGKKQLVTVLAADVRRAIENATNHKR